MATETKLTARLVKSWREMGAEVLNVTGGGKIETKNGKSFVAQSPGWPDLFVCHRLWSGWLEIKGAETRVAPHQIRIIKALEKQNNAWIVRIYQNDKSWRFEISGSDLNPIAIGTHIGTDGQVAAKLLKVLAELDG